MKRREDIHETYFDSTGRPVLKCTTWHESGNIAVNEALLNRLDSVVTDKERLVWGINARYGREFTMTSLWVRYHGEYMHGDLGPFFLIKTGKHREVLLPRRGSTERQLQAV